jgi:hypothetical protein
VDNLWENVHNGGTDVEKSRSDAGRAPDDVHLLAAVTWDLHLTQA